MQFIVLRHGDSAAELFSIISIIPSQLKMKMGPISFRKVSREEEARYFESKSARFMKSLNFINMKPIGDDL